MYTRYENEQSDLHMCLWYVFCLSQIRFGYVENLETTSKKVSIDNYYIQNVSYTTEFKIIISTILVIIKGMGK